MLKLPKEQKDLLVEETARYLEEEYALKLGSLGAEALFDYFLKLVEPIVYNQAIADARNVLLQRMAMLEDELYALEKKVGPSRR